MNLIRFSTVIIVTKHIRRFEAFENKLSFFEKSLAWYWLAILPCVVFFAISEATLQPSYAMTEVTKITAADLANDKHYNLFGSSVSVYTARMAVGSPNDDVGDKMGAGSAYIFEKNTHGDWVQTAKITARDPNTFDHFGSAVSLVGDRLVVGAPNALNPTGLTTGAAYVFEKNQQGTWVQTSKLTPYDAGFDYRFGSAVSLVGDRLVVGAPNSADNARGLMPGAVYVFERDSANAWKQVKIIAPSAGDNARFGSSVWLGDGIMAVGAPLDGTSFAFGFSSVYIYELDTAGKWIQTTRLAASDSAKDDLFGHSVALEKNTLVVGAPFADKTTNVGSAYVFERDSANAWKQVKIMTPSAGDNAGFGSSVAISSGKIIIGAPFASDESGEETGAVFVFEPDNSNQLVQTEKIIAPDAAAGDQFGNTISVMDGMVVVGSPFDDMYDQPSFFGGFNTGSVHVYRLH